MTQKDQQVTCTQCLKPFSAPPKITFGGFQKFQCPHCRKIILYPIARKSIYWLIPIIVAAIFFLALVSITDSEWGNQFLASGGELTLYINDYKSVLLWPLLLWSLVRLGGMYSKKVLGYSRKILYFIGIVALAGVLVALLGLIASMMSVGLVWPPVLGGLILLVLFVIGLLKDAALRKKIEMIQHP